MFKVLSALGFTCSLVLAPAVAFADDAAPPAAAAPDAMAPAPMMHHHHHHHHHMMMRMMHHHHHHMGHPMKHDMSPAGDAPAEAPK